MSKIKLLNALNITVLQWLFVRLTRCEERRVIECEEINQVILMKEGLVTEMKGKLETWEWYSIQVFVLPLSGYFGKSFRYLNKKPFYIKLTSQVRKSTTRQVLTTHKSYLDIKETE